MVDCGSGALVQLERTGRSYRDIDCVFLTHLHPDHVSDLGVLLQALQHTPGFNRTKPLSIFGSSELHRKLALCIPRALLHPDGFVIRLKEMSGPVDLPGLRILSMKTMHKPESLAYRFEAGGRSIVITGDSDFSEPLAGFSRAADLLVADCSFPHRKKIPGHMSAMECGILARNAGARELILSHIYPAGEPDEDRIAECTEAFQGRVTMARDLMEIEPVLPDHPDSEIRA